MNAIGLADGPSGGQEDLAITSAAAANYAAPALGIDTGRQAPRRFADVVILQQSRLVIDGNTHRRIDIGIAAIGPDGERQRLTRIAGHLQWRGGLGGRSLADAATLAVLTGACGQVDVAGRKQA